MNPSKPRFHFWITKRGEPKSKQLSIDDRSSGGAPQEALERGKRASDRAVGFFSRGQIRQKRKRPVEEREGGQCQTYVNNAAAGKSQPAGHHEEGNSHEQGGTRASLGRHRCARAGAPGHHWSHGGKQEESRLNPRRSYSYMTHT